MGGIIKITAIKNKKDKICVPCDWPAASSGSRPLTAQRRSGIGFSMPATLMRISGSDDE